MIFEIGLDPRNCSSCCFHFQEWQRHESEQGHDKVVKQATNGCSLMCLTRDSDFTIALCTQKFIEYSWPLVNAGPWCSGDQNQDRA